MANEKDESSENEESGGLGGVLGGRASELMKKVLTAGVGAAVLSEEGLRSLMSEIKLPKELLGGVLKSANESRKEFLQNLSTEIISKLKDRIDPLALTQEILRTNEIELQVKIKFKPKE